MGQAIFLGWVFFMGAACRDIAVRYCDDKRNRQAKRQKTAIRNAVNSERRRRDMYEAMEWGCNT